MNDLTFFFDRSRGFVMATTFWPKLINC